MNTLFNNDVSSHSGTRVVHSRARTIIVIFEITIILALLIIWFAFKSVHNSKSLLILFFYSFPSEFLIGLVPHEPVLLYFGRFYHPLIVALVSIIGTVLAEALNYSVFSYVSDFTLFEKMKRKKSVTAIIRLFNKAPFSAIIIAGFTPVPFFPIRFLVVMARYPRIKYLFGVFLSRTPRFYILAQIGYTFIIPGFVLLTLFIILIITINFPFVKNILRK